MDATTAPSTRLHELFEAQVDLRPSGTALIDGDERLSYRELDERANQFARYLTAQGIESGDLVALFLDRSAGAIVALLGVLKSGAGYVPIDPIYPPDRVQGIVADAEIVLLITEQRLADRAAACFDGRTMLIDGHAQAIAGQSVERLSREQTGGSATDLCYVIFTSGTTGRPKGIMTEHRNAVRFVQAFNAVCRMSQSDRVYQGFSLGFDGSVEEIWMAFSNGATLVIGPPEIARLGNETAHLITENRVTYLSTVPTFLSMIDEDLPTVRLLVVSAEPCPPELVARWATPSRRMLNVYGPTEATVNTTAAECRPGRPVTIGQPLPGYEAYVLDARLRRVPPGETGELCIGGVTLARGYLNRPDLTAKQFIHNPFNGKSPSSRLYRSGDLVRLNSEGEFEFLGRIDRQVKIRGFRVELSEIESVLHEHPAVRTAVVTVYDHEGTRDLAAYVVPHGSPSSFDRNSVLEMLRKRLPAYMVPAYLDLIDDIPRLSSGKIDRKAFPKPQTALVRTDRQVVAPTTPVERKVTEIWEEIFKVHPISIDDDFFLDLGGYSLLAAQAVSLLRNRFDLDVAIRDVYEHTSIRKLAAHLADAAGRPNLAAASPKQSRPRRSSREVFRRQWPCTRWCCLAMQAIALPVIYGLAVAPMLMVFWLIFSVVDSSVAASPAMWIFVALIPGAISPLLVPSILLKWLLIGRYRPGAYPLWGFYYFRWWLVTRVQALSGIDIFAGTPVMSLYYRLMGAKVGRRCILDTSLCYAFDLVSIGDDSSIGAETQLPAYRIEDGMLVFGTIEIGNRCFVGIHSTMGLGTRLGDDSRLGDLSMVPDGQRIAEGQSCSGSPAQPAQVQVPQAPQGRAARRHPLLFGLIHILLAEAVAIFLLLTSLPSSMIVVFAYLAGGVPLAMASLLIAVPYHAIWFCLAVAGFKSLVQPTLKPGVYSIESPTFLRIWTIQAMLRASRIFLHPLFTTIYLSPWLRLLGATIGVRAEISTVTQLIPELITIDDESFFADGSMIGGRHFFGGQVEFAANRIGRRSFVGNSAYLPMGQSLGDGCLLGVLSVPPSEPRRVPDGTEWLGAPSFRLPYRQKVEGFEQSVTYRPTLWLYAQRMVIDALRIFIPYYLVGMAGLAFFAFLMFVHRHLPGYALLILAPPVATLLAVGTSLCVVALKHLLMAPFKPVIKPLWSTYVWWNEVINGAYESVATPAMAPMKGTPFFNWYLRLLGCKIGKHVFLETPLFSEFDLVDIGDYAALNLGVVVQNHLFEDRVMKSSYLHIEDECSVGNMAVVLYDTRMQRGASIAPLSLLMKGETLAPATQWQGIPTRILEPAQEV